MTLDEALEAVRQEYLKAAKKFKPFNSRHEGYAIIKEEVEELWGGIKTKGTPQKAISLEATQVGAMAVRFLIDCDEFIRDTKER